MRRQRLGLVQTADQLRFSYIAILQGALQDMELEASNYSDLVDEKEEDLEDEDEMESDDSELGLCGGEGEEDVSMYCFVFLTELQNTAMVFQQPRVEHLFPFSTTLYEL